jgi:PTS system mannose-specific IIC component
MGMIVLVLALIYLQLSPRFNGGSGNSGSGKGGSGNGDPIDTILNNY